MKVAVDMGHCPKSTGAVGYLNELDEDRKIGRALIAELKARGHGVVDVTPADSAAESLSGRAQRANAAGADFFASIHLNAGGGTGTEVYTTSGGGAKAQAAATSAAVAEVLGLKNRGRKTANYTVLVKTNMPAMLVEVCFVDTSKDAEAYRATTPEKIAAAIADGILGESKGVTASEPTATHQPPKRRLVRLLRRLWRWMACGARTPPAPCNAPWVRPLTASCPTSTPRTARRTRACCPRLGAGRRRQRRAARSWSRLCRGSWA